MHYVGKRTYNHFKTDTFYGVKLTGIRRCSADFSSISWLEIGQYYPDSQPGMHLTMEKLSKYSYKFLFISTGISNTFTGCNGVRHSLLGSCSFLTDTLRVSK